MQGLCWDLLACGCPVVLVPFVKKIIFSSIDLQLFFCQLSFDYIHSGSSSKPSILFHWSLCLHLSFLYEMGHTFQFFNISSNFRFVLDIWNQARNSTLCYLMKSLYCYISLKSVLFFFFSSNYKLYPLDVNSNFSLLLLPLAWLFDIYTHSSYSNDYCCS